MIKCHIHLCDDLYAALSHETLGAAVSTFIYALHIWGAKLKALLCNILCNRLKGIFILADFR